MGDRHQRLGEEMSRLCMAYPGLSYHLAPGGGGLVTGLLEVADGVSFSVKMFVPAGYPTDEPVLFVEPDEIPWKLDRHVYEKSGIGCLCARSEVRMHWPWGSDLTEFVTKLVHPFLVGQFYYDTHGQWPPTGERSHGRDGILEAFTELLEPEFGEPRERQIRSVLHLLARKNSPKGHEFCPCGSGKRLRDCHRSVIARLRECVDPRHAALDLKEAFKTNARAR